MSEQTEDQRALLVHVSRFGSDGYPVRKVGSHHWHWSFRSIEGPQVVFKTKRECVRQFEEYLDGLREARRPSESLVRTLFPVITR